AAEDGLDGGVVAVAEDRVLVEDENLLAAPLEERVGGVDVLQRLTARTERVLVDARDGVGRGRAGDEQDMVLSSERRDLERDAGRDTARQDLVALADQVLRGRDGRGRVRLVVDEREVDRLPVDLSGAAGRVLQAVP